MLFKFSAFSLAGSARLQEVELTIFYLKVPKNFLKFEGVEGEYWQITRPLINDPFTPKKPKTVETPENSKSAVGRPTLEAQKRAAEWVHAKHIFS